MRLLGMDMSNTKRRGSLPPGLAGRWPRLDDGGEPVTVDPSRPRQGDGGAAAPMEFDSP